MTPRVNGSRPGVLCGATTNSRVCILGGMIDEFKEEIRRRAGQSLQPAIDIPTGEYTLGEMLDIQPITAEDGKKHIIATEADLPTDDNTSVRYGTYPLDTVGDAFSATLADFVGMDPENVAENVIDGLVPREDMRALGWSRPKDIDLFPEQDTLLEAQMKFGKSSSDVVRANDILDSITADREYYPPFFSPDVGVLDGAHRTAVLIHLLSMDGEIYAWEHLG